MHHRLLNVLCIIAIALSPVWGVPSVHAMNHAAYPIWPSFLSTGCNALQGPGGSTTISCGAGSFLLSQVNSGYECTSLDIDVTTFNSGEWLATGSVDSGSQVNNVFLNGSGSYFMQFSGYLTNNIVTVQIGSRTGGALTIGGITTSPCTVPDTATPVPPTNTPNPSDTATPVPNTATPGPSQTPTTIATFTPLPSGHKTFTPTVGPTSTTSPTVTPTPGVGDTEINCGSPSWPLLNCNLAPSTYNNNNPDHWCNSATHAGGSAYWPCGGRPGAYDKGWFEQDSSFNDGNQYVGIWVNQEAGANMIITQVVTTTATGTLYVNMSSFAFLIGPFGSPSCHMQLNGTNVSGIVVGVNNLGSVNPGSYNFSLACGEPANNNHIAMTINNAWVGSSANTPIPASTATVTPTAGAATAVPSDTGLPIPGAQSTPIATSTECPGGCAVAALTAIPGLSTRVLVDTSPFSELTHLSLARNSCKAFGYVQIPEPVIHGTPALGSTTPLSITWTLPITHDWDNTNPYSNTAIQPCAMNEVPTFVWDLTYWFSVFAIFTVWIMWLLGFVGRFSGDENING